MCTIVLPLIVAIASEPVAQVAEEVDETLDDPEPEQDVPAAGVDSGSNPTRKSSANLAGVNKFCSTQTMVCIFSKLLEQMFKIQWILE